MTRSKTELQAAAGKILREEAERAGHRLPVGLIQGIIAEAWENGRLSGRPAPAVPADPLADPVCRWCQAPLIPSGPRPDWAAAVAGWPYPVLYCPGRGIAGFPVHEPGQAVAP